MANGPKWQQQSIYFVGSSNIIATQWLEDKERNPVHLFYYLSYLSAAVEYGVCIEWALAGVALQWYYRWMTACVGVWSRLTCPTNSTDLDLHVQQIHLISTYMSYKFNQNGTAHRALLETDNAMLFHPVSDLFWEGGAGPKPDRPPLAKPYSADYSWRSDLFSTINRTKMSTQQALILTSRPSPTVPTIQPAQWQNGPPPPLTSTAALIETYR